MKFLSTIKLVSILFVLSVSNLYAADLLVPSQYSTIQSAIDAANTNDRVIVSPGTYIENINFNLKNIELISQDGAEATFISGAVDNDSTVELGPLGLISGFTISSRHTGLGSAIRTIDVGAIIENNIIENSLGNGIISAFSSSPIIRNNIIRNNGSFESANNNCSIVIFIANSTTTRIENNLFYGNGCKVFNTGTPVGSAYVIANNTIVGNKVGIDLTAVVDQSAHLIINNIIAFNDIGVSDRFSFGNLPQWENNLVFGNDINYENIQDQTGNNGNISSDPLFFDLNSFNFRLNSNSPAIDSGNNSNAPVADFDGVTRPIDGNNDTISVTDIGAFEFNPNGVIIFQQSGYSVDEDDLSVDVSICRLGGLSGDVSVMFNSAVGTAMDGVHFNLTNALVQFSDGESGCKTVSIPIIGNQILAGDVTFSISLNNPLGGVTLGNQSNVVVNIVDNEVDVSINKDASQTNVQVGENVTYDITVTNIQTSNAQEVTVTDILPASLTYVSASPSQGSCSGTTTVTCNLGDLVSGNSATVTLVVTGNTAGDISNTANVSVNGNDIDSTNDSDSVTVTVNALPTAVELFPLIPGTTFNYLVDTSIQETETVLPQSSFNGVQAFGVEDNEGDIEYFTNDANGLQDYGSLDTVDGQIGTVSPPVKFLEAQPVIGQVINQTGTFTLTDPSAGAFPLDYAFSSTVQGLETITVPLGTFETLKVDLFLQVSGFINGVFVTLTETSSSWLASGIGEIRSVTTLDGVTETRELVSVLDPPAITSPADGTTLSGSSVTVTWDGMGVTPPNWAVNAGTSPGAFNLATSGALPSNATQVTLNNLPTNGQPIYIQLYNNASGAYAVADENMYMAFDPSSTPSVTINATPSSIMPGESATLTWDSSNVDSCTASGDWNGAQATSGSASTGVLNVVNTYTYTLMCSGVNGSASASTTVTVAVNTNPQILLPTDGTTLSGSSVTVTWDGMGVTPPNWAVNAGTSPGAFNLATSGALPSNATQVTLNNLPTNGQPIYIQLYNNASGAYAVADENMYMAFDPSSTPSVTINATPSSIMPGESATLTWDSSNVDSCTASGDWNGAQATSGSASTGVLNVVNTYTYTLMCSGVNGSASASTTVTVAVNTNPQILLPTDGTTLSGSSVTVTWDGMGVTPPNWAVNAGTSPGAFNLATSGALPSNATQVTLNNLPTNGQPIYIQLYNNASGAYAVADENMYMAFDPSSTPSVTINATPSSIMPGESATLTWDSSNVDSCTASGDWNGAQATSGSASTGVLNVVNTYTYTLMCSGVNGSASASTTVTVAVNTNPQILLPTDGTTLSGSSVTVTWDGMGVTPPNWAVNAGTSPGAFNLATSGALPSNATQVTLNNLPTNGQPIYIQLYNNASGAYAVADENMYMAFDPSSTPSVTINATPSSIMPGESATLTWDSSNVDSCTASGDWNGAQATSGSASTGVLNVVNTYTYTLMCSGVNGSASASTTVTVAVNTNPQILLPTDGTTLSGSSVTVTWDGMGVTPPNWAVNAGTSPGAFNLATSGALPSNATQVTLNNLPTNGQPIYIQLYNNASGAYAVADENMYMAFDPSSTPSVTINATPSSIMPGESATLTWDSSNVDSCTASGDWNGAQATSGSASTGVLNVVNTYTYTLMCSGVNGSASASTTVTVAVNTNPQILLPTDGTTLSGSSVTVTWDGMGVTPPNWAVNAGTSPGAFNLATSGALPSNATQVTLNNLPTNGQPIYIQLYNNASGAYAVADENMYMAATLFVGTYNVSGTQTDTGCTDTADNGTSSYTGIFTVTNQTNNTYTGALTILTVDGISLSGTGLSATGSFNANNVLQTNASGNYILNANQGTTLIARNEGTFTSTINGNTISTNYAGMDTVGDICLSTGSFSGAR